MNRKEEIKYIRNKTGCSMRDCQKALKYAENNLNGRDKHKLAIAILKSHGIAINTGKMSKDERIDMFYEMEVMYE